MTDENLKKLLRAVKDEAKPDNNWKANAREVLLTQISSQVGQKFSATDKVVGFFKLVLVFINNYILAKGLAVLYRPVVTMVLIVCFVFGGGMFTVKASKTSIPGDKLYYLKRTLERARLSLAVDEESKLMLQIDFAKERAKEIDQLKSLKSNNNAEKVKNEIDKATIEIKNNLDSAKAAFKEIQSKANTDDIIEVARLIDQKTTEIETSLTDIEDNKENIIVQAAILSANNIGSESIDVIVRTFETGESDVEENEVDYLVNKKLDSLNIKIFRLENDSRQLAGKLKNDYEELMGRYQEDGDNDNELEKIAFNQDKVRGVQEILDTKIKDLMSSVFSALNNKDFFSALDLIMEGHEQVEALQDEIAEISQEQPTQAELAEDSPADQENKESEDAQLDLSVDVQQLDSAETKEESKEDDVDGLNEPADEGDLDEDADSSEEAGSEEDTEGSTGGQDDGDEEDTTAEDDEGFSVSGSIIKESDN